MKFIDVLIAGAIIFGLLSISAELERRDQIAMTKMEKKRLADERARHYGELSARACYMTSCDKIVVRK